MGKRFQYRYLVIPVVACTIIIGIIIGIVVMNIGNKKAGIEGNKIDYHYPFFSVELLMGKPDKKIEIAESDLTVYHYLDRTLFGQRGSISYYVHLFRVDRIILKINTNYDEAHTLFDKITQSIEDEYKEREGYYCNPIVEKETGELIQNMGVHKGTGGISFTLSYRNGELRVDGSCQ